MRERVRAVAAPLRAFRLPEGLTRALSPARTSGGRIHFVDFLRLAASVQMLHGHTMDALMAEDLRQGAFYANWSWARGLVSVAFMVAAGLSFHLSTLARFEKHKADRRKVIGRFRRAFWLIFLGYLLHFPAAVVFGGDVARSLREFAMVDVLQCIGVAILILQTLTVLCRCPRQVVWACLGLAILCIGLAPLGDRVAPEGPFLPLINYLTHRGGSLFPLLPCAGWVFAGVVVAEIVLPRGTRTQADPFPKLAFLAAGVLALWGVMLAVPLTLADERTFGGALPAFNVLKLGLVLVIAAAFAFLGRFVGRLPRWLEIVAQESLALYVSHLLVLFVSGVGLYRLFGHSLSLGASLTVAGLMIPAAFAWALVFHRHKAWRRARYGW